jgi:hypothetical protein
LPTPWPPLTISHHSMMVYPFQNLPREPCGHIYTLIIGARPDLHYHPRVQTDAPNGSAQDHHLSQPYSMRRSECLDDHFRSLRRVIAAYATKWDSFMNGNDRDMRAESTMLRLDYIAKKHELWPMWIFCAESGDGCQNMRTRSL